MNRLGETYIADKLTAYHNRLCAGWRFHCVELLVQDERADLNTR